MVLDVSHVLFRIFRSVYHLSGSVTEAKWNSKHFQEQRPKPVTFLNTIRVNILNLILKFLQETVDDSSNLFFILSFLFYSTEKYHINWGSQICPQDEILNTLSQPSILAAFWVEKLHEKWENNRKILSEKDCIPGWLKTLILWVKCK